MAALHGKDASVTFANLTVGIDTWSLNYSTDMVETTSFDNVSSGHKAYTAGLADWTATLSGHLDGTESPLVQGSSGAMTLTYGPSDTWIGTATLQNISVDTGVNDKITVTYEFQGTGTLTLAYA